MQRSRIVTRKTISILPMETDPFRLSSIATNGWRSNQWLNRWTQDIKILIARAHASHHLNDIDIEKLLFPKLQIKREKVPEGLTWDMNLAN